MNPMWIQMTIVRIPLRTHNSMGRQFLYGTRRERCWWGPIHTDCGSASAKTSGYPLCRIGRHIDQFVPLPDLVEHRVQLVQMIERHKPDAVVAKMIQPFEVVRVVLAHFHNAQTFSPSTPRTSANAYDSSRRVRRSWVPLTFRPC